MLSRALSLATVMLLIGCLSVRPAQAQATNLEAGKSPSQIFAGTCTACHKSPRGLLKTVPAGSLPGFLRQHYTTSPEMAGLLSSFLVSNGAADTRFSGNQAKDAKSEAKPGGPSEQLDRFGHRIRPAATQEAAKPQTEPREAAKPDADGHSPQAEPEPGRHGRNAKRLARPGEAPEPAAEGSAPVQAATEGGPEGRRTAAKQRLSKRGRPGSEEPPKIDAAKTDAAKTDAAKTDAAKTDAAKTDAAKTDAAKTDAAKTDAAKEEPAKGEAVKDEAPKDASKSETAKVESSKPAGEGKSESAKIEAPKATGGGETPALRADPVPPVTPAPSASPAVSAAVSGGAQEPAAVPSVPAAAPAPAVTASSAPPIAPAGPPAPPISQ